MGVNRTLLRTFYDTVVASAIFYAVVCWRGGMAERDRGKLNKLVRRASSVLDCPLKSIETVRALSSSFSSGLLRPQCRKERYRRSFLPAAVRLYNAA